MYQVIDTDNNRIIGTAETMEEAARLGLDLCDLGEMTTDEAVSEYMREGSNINEAFGISVREVK